MSLETDSKFLTNFNAMKIFLNTMGYILEEQDSINTSSKIKIKNKNMEDVGVLLLRDKKIVAKVKDDKVMIKANCDLLKSGITHNSNDLKNITTNWVSKIDFTGKTNNLVKMSGEFLFCCGENSDHERVCNCLPIIDCVTNYYNNINIRILRNDLAFKVVFEKIITRESIELTAGHNGTIKHRTLAPAYMKHSGVYNSPEYGENRNKLYGVVIEECEGNKPFKTEVYEDKNFDPAKWLSQKGSLMRKIDSSVIKRMDEIRQLLATNDTFLLDNLFAVCFEEYDNETLYELFGIHKSEKVYQDDVNSLSEAFLKPNCISQAKQSFFKKRTLKK